MSYDKKLWAAIVLLGIFIVGLQSDWDEKRQSLRYCIRERSEMEEKCLEYCLATNNEKYRNLVLLDANVRTRMETRTDKRQGDDEALGKLIENFVLVSDEKRDLRAALGADLCESTVEGPLAELKSRILECHSTLYRSCVKSCTPLGTFYWGG